MTTTQKTHSPLPWKFDHEENLVSSTNGYIIDGSGLIFMNEDQEFLIRAVNSHYNLLNACEQAIKCLEMDSEPCLSCIELLKEAIGK